MYPFIPTPSLRTPSKVVKEKGNRTQVTLAGFGFIAFRWFVDATRLLIKVSQRWGNCGGVEKASARLAHDWRSQDALSRLEAVLSVGLTGERKCC